MKYLFISVLLFTINLFGQTHNDTLSSSESNVFRNKLIIAGGTDIQNFDTYLIRLGYLNNFDNKFYMPYELEYISTDDGQLVLGSVSARICHEMFTKSNIYLQGGVSFTLGGAESIVLFPGFNIGIGAIYRDINLEIRSIIFNFYSLNSSPLFLTIGINLEVK